jgi:hypothetical protein
VAEGPPSELGPVERFGTAHGQLAKSSCISDVELYYSPSVEALDHEAVDPPQDRALTKSVELGYLDLAHTTFSIAIRFML